MTATPTLLLPREVARILGCDPKTAARYEAKGKLTAVRTLGGARRFTVESVRAALVAGGTSAAEADLRIAAALAQSAGGS